MALTTHTVAAADDDVSAQDTGRASVIAACTLTLHGNEAWFTTWGSICWNLYGDKVQLPWCITHVQHLVHERFTSFVTQPEGVFAGRGKSADALVYHKCIAVCDTPRQRSFVPGGRLASTLPKFVTISCRDKINRHTDVMWGW